MIKIRLSRVGTKNRPFYRVIATDARNKLKGKHLDIIGYWNPKEKGAKINKDKLAYWKGLGAKLSKRVDNLLK